MCFLLVWNVGFNQTTLHVLCGLKVFVEFSCHTCVSVLLSAVCLDIANLFLVFCLLDRALSSSL